MTMPTVVAIETAAQRSSAALIPSSFQRRLRVPSRGTGRAPASVMPFAATIA
jgi:hypothetical protein